MSTFIRRCLGASMLNAAVYEEVEAHRHAGRQALIVVLLSSIAAGLGSRGFGATQPAGVLFFATVSLVAWIAWASLTYQVGVGTLPTSQTRADLGQLLRTTGFASAPGLARIVGVIPQLTALAFIVTTVWMLLAMLVAVRQALDYKSTGRAIAVCLLGWSLAIVFAVVLGVLFGPRLS